MAALADAAERVAVCITGSWRSFGQAAVYESIAENATESLASAGAEVRLFYVVESAGVGLDEVSGALRRLPPYSLAVDVPGLEVPVCLRANFAHLSSFMDFNKVQQCFHFVQRDERSTGRRWGWLVRVRTDMQFFRPLGPIGAYDHHFLHVPPAQHLGFAQASWGFAHTCIVLDDRFAIAPRNGAAALFDAVDDVCASPHDASLVCFAPHLQYLLHRRLRAAAAPPLRFLPAARYRAVKVASSRAVDPSSLAGRIYGTPWFHALDEARYRVLTLHQPFAFGDGFLGASMARRAGVSAELAAAAGAAAGQAAAASSAGGSALYRGEDPARPRVVLEPKRAFRDHVAVVAARACRDQLPAPGVAHGAAPGGAPDLALGLQQGLLGAGVSSVGARSDSGGYLQVRVYRPVDPARRFWRLVGASMNLWPSSPSAGAAAGAGAAAANEGAECFVVPLDPPIAAAPGDCLGYVAEAPLMRAGAASGGAVLVGRGIAAVGRFDEFSEVVRGPGLALGVDTEHLDRRAVAPGCFMADADRPFVSFDFCCDMEVQGPEGNAACWNLPGEGASSDGWAFTYEQCCIDPRNRRAPESVPRGGAGGAGGAARATAALLSGLAARLKKRRAAVRETLEAASRDLLQDAQAWDPRRQIIEAYAPPFWPAGASRPRYTRAGPRLLFEVLRLPVTVCEVLFAPQFHRANRTSHVRRGSERAGAGPRGPVRLEEACAGLVLQHARLIAAALGVGADAHVLFQRSGLL